jgi:hypothetical protein
MVMAGISWLSNAVSGVLVYLAQMVCNVLQPAFIPEGRTCPYNDFKIWTAESLKGDSKTSEI